MGRRRHATSRIEPTLDGLSSTFGRVNAADAASPADAGDFSLALRRACVAASAIGAAVYIPSGAYTASTVCEVGDLDNVRIEAAPDAVITIDFDGTFFRVGPPTWEAIQAATPPAVAGDYWGARSTVVVADATAYEVGDLIRVVADDKAPCTRATPGDGTDYRIGEFAIITAIDTGTDTLTLDRPLEHAYVTNPRVGRLPRRVVNWRGGRVGYEAGHASTGGTGGTGWRGTAFQFYGVSDLVVDVEIRLAYNSAVNLTGCFEAAISGVGGNITNNQSNLQYGYFVNDASEYTSVTAVVAGRTRHGYTTNMPVVAADSTSLHLYGETRRAVVHARSDGDTQAGVDTHHGSVGCTFFNPAVSGGMTGGGQSVIRGRDHRIVNPVLSNGKDGLLIYTESGVTEQTSGIEVINPDIDVDRYPLVLDNAAATVRGGKLRSRKYGDPVLVATGSTLTIRGTLEVRPGGTTEVNSYRAFGLDDSDVDATGATIIFDLQDIPNTATNYGCVQGDGDTGSSWTGGRLLTINDTYLTCVFYKQSGAAGTMDFGGNDLTIETSIAGANPKTTMDVTGGNGVGFTGPWKWRHLGGAGSTGYIERTISSDGYVLPWYGRDDDRVIARLFVNTTPRTLGALPDGTHLGQVLHLSVTLAGGASLTLKHGDATYNTGLKGGSDMVFSSAESGVTLIWNGSLWTSVTP